MPRYYRLVIIAAFGWLSLAAGPTINETTQPKQPETAAQKDRSLESIAEAQNKTTKAADSSEYQSPCDDGQYNNKSDLCAQWYAAKAARDAADWAWWALIVGTLSAAGIVAALLLTVQSNKLARTAYLTQRDLEDGWIILTIRRAEDGLLGPVFELSASNVGRSDILIKGVYFSRSSEAASKNNPPKMLSVIEAQPLIVKSGETKPLHRCSQISVTDDKDCPFVTYAVNRNTRFSSGSSYIVIKPETKSHAACKDGYDIVSQWDSDSAVGGMKLSWRIPAKRTEPPELPDTNSASVGS